MAANDTIISFNEVSFGYDHERPLLEEVSFSVRRGSKFTIMGQNGAGKSTILKLLEKVIKPESGQVNVDRNLKVATSHQVIRPEDRDLTVLEFFEKNFDEKKYDIGRRIDEVLEVVNLKAPHDRIIKSFSGGQQARLLLASALIQDPDLLLLDEPTNNLDKAGIDHLTEFLIMSDKSCIVISHDADFLNCFTDGVLYLDVFTKKVEQYVGNYFDVVEQIEIRREKENRKNAMLEKEIQANKEKSNFFANKGGGMRLVAKRMRNKAAEMEEAMVDVRREDKTIRDFTIPAQEDLVKNIVSISSVKTIHDHVSLTKQVGISLKKNSHLLLSGPNGIGKSTLLESLANGTAEGASVDPDIRIGYYRQDFSNLDFNQTVHEALSEALVSSDLTKGKSLEEYLRSVASGFLITSDVIRSKIGVLSEGQKGLVAFARLVLLQPGLLILDEPTNHINFRHLPVIAKALDDFKGAMILVSHVPEFVSQIRIDEVLDLTK
jgi:ATPase subunit of ABC transporter with duplicated ATPase domains